jgi:SAM-dependent methyltransferase
VYADVAVAQSEMDEVYKDHSKYAVNIYVDETNERTIAAPPPADAPFDVERLKRTAEFIRDALPDRSSRVLDAGCGTGSLLGFLKDFGYSNLLGLDPSPTAAKTVVEVHGVPAIAGSFLAPPSDVVEFDIVTLCHVLEHLTDVRGAVAGLNRILKLGGVAYVEVPDAKRYVDFLIAPYHDFNSEHINHFSLNVLDQLMRANGFEPVMSQNKLVYISPTAEYPAVFGLWRKIANEAATDFEWRRDEELVRTIRSYVGESQRLIGRIDEKLASDLAGDDTVIVWGVGNLTMKMLSDTILGRKRVATFVDSSPQRQGMHIGDAAITAPDSLGDMYPFPIVIASLHHDRSISRTIHETLQLANRTVGLRH